MMTRRKVYVAVSADHESDGTCKPKVIRLANGKRYEIDKILQVSRSASEVGGRGIRSRIKIGQTETYLFDEQNGFWFVEAKFG